MSKKAPALKVAKVSNEMSNSNSYIRKERRRSKLRPLKKLKRMKVKVEWERTL